MAAPALALALLVGCSGPGADSNSSAGGGSVGSGVAAPADRGAPQEAERQVVTTADASVAVEDPAQGA